MSAPRITRAAPWEAKSLVRIMAAHQAEEDWLRRSRDQADEARMIRKMISRRWVYVARQKMRPVGFVACHNGEIHALYIAPQARGQGIGRALLSRAQSSHTRLGLWAHAANVSARGFYMSQGFRPMRIGEGNDEGLTEIRYEWEASP